MKIEIKSSSFIIFTREDISSHFSYNENVTYFIRGKRHTKSVRKCVIKKLNAYSWSAPIGYIYYAVNIFNGLLDSDNVRSIMDSMKSQLSLNNFYTAYEWQVDALKSLTKWKRGIMSMYTGAGKSEMISILICNCIDQGLRVLLLAANNSSLQEIVDRLAKYDVKVRPNKIQWDASINACNPVALIRSNEWDRIKSYGFKFFKSVDVVISDETEMVVHESYRKIEKLLENAQYFYGFSATINKSSISEIPRDKSLRSRLNSQLHSIIRTYGCTQVHLLPTGKEVTISTLYTRLPKVRGKYHESVSDIMVSPEFIHALRHVMRVADNLFIPINNLEVLDKLIRAELSDITARIDGSGIKLYKSGKYLSDVSLDNLKTMILERKVRLVVGSSSSFRALDLRGISNALVSFGKATSSVIQYVGRASRGDKMNLWFIDDDSQSGFYSKTISHNQRLIVDYYQKCKIEYNEYYL